MRRNLDETMSLRRPARVAIAAAATFVLTPALCAHEREFTLSRDWFLPSRGESEIESRTFWSTRHGSVEDQLEYEYGLTSSIALEPGLTFHRGPGEEMELEAFEMELRFRFGRFEYGRVLPALNVEYEHAVEDGEPDHGELKLILSEYGSDGQDFTVNVNVGKELESGGEGESEATFGYVRPLGALEEAGQAGWRSKPRIGLEGVQDFEKDHTGLGPLLVWRGNEHLNVLGACVFGLNERDENEDQFRLILEWEF